MLPRYLASILLLAVQAVLTGSTVSADDEKERLIAFLKDIDELVEDGNVSAAVKKIESQGDTTKVMRH